MSTCPARRSMVLIPGRYRVNRVPAQQGRVLGRAGDGDLQARSFSPHHGRNPAGRPPSGDHRSVICRRRVRSPDFQLERGLADAGRVSHWRHGDRNVSKGLPGSPARAASVAAHFVRCPAQPVRAHCEQTRHRRSQPPPSNAGFHRPDRLFQTGRGASVRPARDAPGAHEGHPNRVTCNIRVCHLPGRECASTVPDCAPRAFDRFRSGSRTCGRLSSSRPLIARRQPSRPANTRRTIRPLLTPFPVSGATKWSPICESRRYPCRGCERRLHR